MLSKDEKLIIYNRLYNVCGLHVGQDVRIKYVNIDDLLGWPNTFSKPMSNYYNATGRIVRKSIKGIKLNNNSFGWPFYCFSSDLDIEAIQNELANIYSEYNIDIKNLFPTPDKLLKKKVFEQYV